MAVKKFLDYTGLAYFWTKIKNLLEQVTDTVLTDSRLPETIINVSQQVVEDMHSSSQPAQLDMTKPTTLENQGTATKFYTDAVHLTSSGKSWKATSDGGVVLQSIKVLIGTSSLSVNGVKVWSDEGLSLAVGSVTTNTIRVSKDDVITSVSLNTLTFYPNKVTEASVTSSSTLYSYFISSQTQNASTSIVRSNVFPNDMTFTLVRESSVEVLITAGFITASTTLYLYNKTNLTGSSIASGRSGDQSFSFRWIGVLAPGTYNYSVGFNSDTATGSKSFASCAATVKIL
jgi:hypothetical protein